MGREISDLPMSGDQRAGFGYLATLVRLGRYPEELVTLHLHGATRDAMQDLVTWIELHEGDWRVRSISSPVSIYRDLHGSRRSKSLRSRETLHGNPRSTLTFDPFEVERHHLALVGRIDLLIEPTYAPALQLQGVRR